MRLTTIPCISVLLRSQVLMGGDGGGARGGGGGKRDRDAVSRGARLGGVVLLCSLWLEDPPLPVGLAPHKSLSHITQCLKTLYCVDATASSGSISSSQARYGILGLPRSFSTHTTASMKHVSKKKSKKGRAGKGSGLKGSRRAVEDAESAGGNISGDWTLGSVPSQGEVT